MGVGKAYKVVGALVFVGLGLAALQEGKPAPDTPVSPKPAIVPAAEKPPSPTDLADDKIKQWTWIAASQDGIRKKLKDPDSAKFEDVFFSKSGGTPVACGRVNSKNGFGGYTGFQRFVAAGEVVGFLEEEAGPGEFTPMWDKMCSRER